MGRPLCGNFLSFAIHAVLQDVPHGEEKSRTRSLRGTIDIFLDPFLGFCSPTGGHWILRHEFSFRFWNVLIHGFFSVNVGRATGLWSGSCYHDLETLADPVDLDDQVQDTTSEYSV